MNKLQMMVAEKKAKEEGFTLIELLVVIVILGILAAVVVFAVGGITDKGEDAACEATGQSIEVAIEAFRANSAASAYPASLDDIDDGLYIRDDLGTGVILSVTIDGNTFNYTPATGALSNPC